MSTKTFYINGEDFDDLQGFYEVVSKHLLSNENWKLGSLDGLNDALYGGFGAFEDADSVQFIWKNSEKSREDLGFVATKKWLEAKLENPNFNEKFIQEKLNDLQKGNEKTLFEIILEIFSDHKEIELVLE